MEITARLCFIFFSTFCLYLYLSDKLTKPETKRMAFKILEPLMGNNTNHTVIKVMDDYTNISSASIAATSMTILANIPRLLREPKHAIYAGVMAGLAGIAKYKLNWLELGFFKVENNSNSTNTSDITGQ